ncbi:uncharacterized protein LOC117177470 [Belonocnema kinseyi]|uniref:uncharacterized protein LOC117177470 n=1 Tax=Belonocnema kinseyi TaxID=2817044 RepID=UPI00143DAED2|nr:uncharacterized protein LOC117177470 [Belonocnema kinseyi]
MRIFIITLLFMFTIFFNSVQTGDPWHPMGPIAYIDMHNGLGRRLCWVTGDKFGHPLTEKEEQEALSNIGKPGNPHVGYMADRAVPSHVGSSSQSARRERNLNPKPSNSNHPWHERGPLLYSEGKLYFRETNRRLTEAEEHEAFHWNDSVG